MKSCKNCIYSYFCYEGKEVLNLNMICSGYVKKEIKKGVKIGVKFNWNLTNYVFLFYFYVG